MMDKLWNMIKRDESPAFMMFFYGCGIFAFLFYIYLPFKLIGLMCVGGVTWATFYILFQYGKTIHCVHYVNMILAVLALHYHWQWGFTFFSWHLERYYCWIFLAASIVAYLVSLISILFRREESERASD